jgi:hypothetical protein
MMGGGGWMMIGLDLDDDSAVSDLRFFLEAFFLVEACFVAAAAGLSDRLSTDALFLGDLET